MKRKNIKVLVILVMIIGMLLTYIKPASAAGVTKRITPLNLTNSKPQEDAREGWSWDNQKRVLTLKGVDISVSKGSWADDDNYGIQVPGGTTIILEKGTVNNIKINHKIDDIHQNYNSYGIIGNGNLTIQGEGQLNVSGGFIEDPSIDTIGRTETVGIYAQGDILINSGTIYTSGSNGDYLYKKFNGEIITDASLSVGQYVGNKNNSRSYGIYSVQGNISINNGNVIATGYDGYNSIGRIGESSGIHAAQGEVNIYGGIVSAIVSNIYDITPSGTVNKGYSGYGIYSHGPLNIEGGTVTVSGGQYVEENPAKVLVKLVTQSAAIYANNTLNISDALVTVRGASSKKSNSYAIYSKRAMDVSGGTLTVIGGDTNAYNNGSSYGIYAEKTLKIANTKVTVIGGDSNKKSYGIYGKEKIDLSSSTLLAKGGEMPHIPVGSEQESYGIFAEAELDLNGGLIVAQSSFLNNGSKAINKEPNLSGLVALTGGYDKKDVIYGSDNTFYVMDSAKGNLKGEGTGLNPIHIPNDAGDHIKWNDADKILTLKNVIINVDSHNPDKDNYGIKGDISKIIYDGDNIILSGDINSNYNSYGIYSSEDLSIEQIDKSNGELISISGTKLSGNTLNEFVSGIYAKENINISKSNIRAIGRKGSKSYGIYSFGTLQGGNYLGEITLNNSDVIAMSKNSSALYGQKKIEINNGTTIVSSEAEIEEGSIYAIKMLKISGGRGISTSRGRSYYSHDFTYENNEIGYLRSTGLVISSTLVWGQTSPYIPLPEQTIEFDNIINGMITKTYGDDNFTLTATRVEADGGDISYSSSDKDVATVDKLTGEVTILNAGEVKITALAEKVEGKYARSTANYYLTVNKRPIIFNDDGKVKDMEYNGSTNATILTQPTYSGILDGDEVKIVAGYSAYFEDKNAGTDKIAIGNGWNISNDIADNKDKDNYIIQNQPKFLGSSITKKQLTANARPINEISRMYNGSKDIIYTLTPTNALSRDEVNITVIATVEDENSGNNKDVTILEVKLSGKDGQNYLPPKVENVKVNILKVTNAITATTPFDVYININDNDEKTLDLKEIFNPEFINSKEEIVYEVSGYYDEYKRLEGIPIIEGTTLKYKKNPGFKLSSAPYLYINKYSQEIIIKSANTNYDSLKAQINFIVTGKPVTTVTVTPPADIIYGQTLGDPSATTSDTVTNESYIYRYILEGIINDGYTSKPTNAGRYSVKANLVDSSSNAGSDSARFTISKATPEGTPTYTKVNQEGKKLSDTKLTGTFKNPHNNAQVPGTITWDLGDGTIVEQDVSYDWTFTPTDTKNYHTVKGSIIPWVKPLDPQTINFSGVIDGKVIKVYGEDNFTLAATVTEEEGGEISYSSSNPSIATVSATGEVTILKAGTTVITATAAEVPKKYAVSKASYTLTVTPKALTWNNDGTVKTKEYDGKNTAQRKDIPTLLGAINNDIVSAREGTITFSDAAVGKDKIVTAVNWSISGANSSNYTAPTEQPIFGNGEITKRQLTQTGFKVIDRQYDGTVDVKFNNLTLGNIIYGENVAYKINVTMADPNVGMNKPLAVDFELSGTHANNYNPPIISATVNIQKKWASVPLPIKETTIYINSSDKDEKTLNLLDPLKNMEKNGEVTFTLSTLSNNFGIIYGAPTLEGAILKYKGNGKTSKEAFQQIVVENSNYRDKVYFKVNFVATNKPVATVNITPPLDIIYGEVLGDPVASVDDITNPTFNFRYSSDSYGPSDIKPINAGVYKVTANLVDTTNYGISSANFTISKATPEGTPTFTEISEENKTLGDTNLSGNFINPYSDAKVSVAGTLTWDDGNEMIVEQGKAYNWTFTPSDTKNYNETIGSIIPWKSPLVPQDIKFPGVTDGNITKVYGDSNFTITARVTETDSGVVSYTSSDETVATVNGSTGEVTILKVGTTTITATAAEVEGKYSASEATYTLRVNPKALIWNNDGKVDTKEYDGTNTATVKNAPTLSGVINEDDVSVKSGNVSFSDAAVGKDKTVTAANWEMQGIDKDNYIAPIEQAIFNNGEITKRKLTITALATDREYNSSKDVVVTLTASNIVVSEEVLLTGKGSMADANAGIGKAVTITDIVLEGNHASNYEAPSNLTTIVNIIKMNSETGSTGDSGFSATTPIGIKIISTDLGEKTLDLMATLNPIATLDAGEISFKISSLENGQDVLNGSPSLDGENLKYKGNGKTTGTAIQNIIIESINYTDITAEIIFTAMDLPWTTVIVTPPNHIIYGEVLGDPSATTTEDVLDGNFIYNYSGENYGPSEIKPTDVGEYTVIATLQSSTHKGSGSSSFTISKSTPRGTPSYTEISEEGKILADTKIEGSFINPKNGILIDGTITWDDGDDMTVVQGASYKWTFTPNDTNNYNFITGNIVPWELDLPGQDISFDGLVNSSGTRVYDHDTFILATNVNGDITGLVSYSSNNEAIATINPLTGEVTMHKVGNVTITARAEEVPGQYRSSTATYSLEITPKVLTWDNDGTVNNKQYDGKTIATVNTLPTLLGIINGDDVRATIGKLWFIDKNAGMDKVVSSGAWNIEGVDKDNYTIQDQPRFSNGTIEKLQLQASALGINKEYDGTSIVLVTIIATNKLESDDLIITGIGTMIDANIGKDKLVTISDIQFSGNDADNYISPIIPSTTVDITKSSNGFTASSPFVIVINKSNTKVNTLDLMSILNPLATSDPGEVSFMLDSLLDSDKLLDGDITLEGKTLTYKGNGKTRGTATQNIIISSDNYTDITAVILFEASDKLLAIVTVTPPNNIIYGEILGDPSATTTDDVKDPEFIYSYSGILDSGEYYGPTTTKPTNPGSYTVVATLQSSTHQGSASANFIISKATPIGTPTYKEIKETGKKLRDTNITVSFIDPITGEIVEGTIRWDEEEDTIIEQGKAYKWTFTPKDPDKYMIITGSIIPWKMQLGGAISGTLNIIGSPSYGKVLTGNVNLSKTPWGNFTYTWKRGLTILKTTMSARNEYGYTVQAEDIGSIITLEVISDYYSGSLIASTNVAIGKTIVKEPSPPIVESKTKTSITLRPSAGYEYSIDGGKTWQNSNEFTNLKPATKYTFMQRIKETPTSLVSGASGSISATTLDKEQHQPPSNLKWEDTGTEVLAKWDSVSNNSGYMVQLYKDGVPVGNPIYVNDSWYDFTSAIVANGNGTYTFTVQTKGDNNDHIDSISTKVPTAYIKNTTHKVSGNVEDEDNKPVEGAEVKIMQGNIQIGVTVFTTADGEFIVPGIPTGSYNLVIKKGDQRVTRYFVISSLDHTFKEVITLPSGKKNSVLEVAKDTPDVVVDKLDDMFKESKIYTPEDDSTVVDGGKVEIKLVVEKNDNAVNVSEITISAKTKGFIRGTVLDLNITKTSTDVNGNIIGFTPINDTNVLLTLVIPIPKEEQGKSSYSLMRAHDYEDGRGVVIEYIGTSPNSNGEKIEINGDESIITAYIRYFSTYAIAYENISKPDNDLEEDDSSSENDEKKDTKEEPKIEIEESTGGKIIVEDKDPKENIIVKIIADEGYVILDVIVDGDSIGQVESYKFTDGKNHKIKAKFVKVNQLPYYLQNDQKIYIGFSNIIGNVYKYIAPNGKLVEFKDNPKNFKDNTIEWAKGSINFVTEREIFMGTSENIFSPNAAMTRGMFVTVIGRLYERSYGDVIGKSTFSDIDPNAYYVKYLSWANENGIVKGIGENKFAPNAEVTREQMAVIIQNFAKFLGKTNSSQKSLEYTDSSSISTWAIEGAKYCQETGLISGKDGGRFAPKENASRAEVAAVIERFIKLIVK